MSFNFRRSYLWLLVLLCACTFAAADGALAAYYDEHTGDSWEDAYIIDSAQDLKDMHERLGYFVVNQSEKYYKLASDISIEVTTSEDWNVEQTYSYTGYINSFYNSHFDGQGHTIKVNLYNENTDSIADIAALFGSVTSSLSSDASIKNLNVTGTVKARRCAAGIAYYVNKATIENCSFSGMLEVNGYTANNDINSYAHAGGIVCVASAPSTNPTNIVKCQFSGDIRTIVDSKASSGIATAGGIVESFYGSEVSSSQVLIDNCSVSSNSTIYASSSKGNSWAGGIGGHGSGATIQNCNSGAEINAKYAGGILGLADASLQTILINNTYPSQYPEVGSGGTEHVVNPNVIDDLKLASLDADYEEYIKDPEAYFESLGDDFGGHIPNPINFEHLADNPAQVNKAFYSAAALPSSYNTSHSNMPPVRNQLSYRTCWSFATIGAMEINYLKDHPSSNADLSELHMAWFVFKDPRTGYKFDYNQGREGQDTLMQGGYIEQPRAFLTRMSGAVQESALPYSKADSVANETKGKHADSYACYMRVKEFYDLGNNARRDDIKAVIQECGGAVAAYESDGSLYLNKLTSAYYKDTAARSGHMVVLIGWDDNYDKTQFAAGHQPANNGAWLARNSKGTSYGDGGYFWMSYEQTLGEITAYKAALAENNLVYYGYDDLGRTGAVNLEYSANMFQVKNAKETLKEVAFYTMDNNAEYEISVYNCGSEVPAMTPIHGEPVAAAKGTMSRAGYHTIDLSGSNASFNQGDWFTVVLHIKPNASHQECTAVEEASYLRNYATGDVVINMYESLFSKDGDTWADGTNTSAVMEGSSALTASKMNACIKAFTVKSGADKNSNSSGGGGGGGGGCSTLPCGLFALSAIALAALKIKTR